MTPKKPDTVPPPIARGYRKGRDFLLNLACRTT